jgi:radical SAM-linked protein
MKVFERALVRTGQPIIYSQGFNPRPKLSLPLPKPVGVESEEDLLIVYVDSTSGAFDSGDFGRRLAEQMPEGFQIISVKGLCEKKAAVPVEAAYYFPLKKELLSDEQRLLELQSKAKDLLLSESIILRRRIYKSKVKFKGSKGQEKQIDIKRYLKDIEFAEDGILVRCSISGEGAIRIDELIEILGLSVDDIKHAIKRKDVIWQY